MRKRAARQAIVTRGAIAAVIWLSGSPAALAQDRAEDAAAANFRILDSIDPCNASRPPGEIVVCGNRRDRYRYRIPQLGQRSSVLGAGNVRGEVPRASAEPLTSGGCGIFQGQHLCSEDEMVEAGYGGGRDPVTFFTNLLTRLADPDADAGTSPPGPDLPRSE